MSSPAVQPLLALLASHVGGNPTQYAFERAFAHHDLDWRYLTFDVEPESLADAVRGLRALGFRGGHCADPFKQAVLPCLDRVTETAAMIGSVNVVFREENAFVGDNNEGRGVVQAIRSAVDPAGKRVVLLGAGRAARAAAVELANAGVAEIAVVNRTEDHAKELAAALTAKFELPVSITAWQGEFTVPSETEILIQAIGRSYDANELGPRLSFESLRPELLVADVTIEPRTPLLDEAAQRGCKTIDGLSMFIEQVALAFHLWTGVDADRQVLREAVEEFLEL